MMLFAYLMLAHLLYDFHWQGDFVGVYKAKNHIIMIVHCVTWALLLTLVNMYFCPWSSSMLVFLYLFTTHWLIDTWKCSQPDNVKLGRALIIDQVLHIITIVAVVLSSVYTYG